MKYIQHLACVIFIATIMACTTVGVQPHSVDEQIAVAYGTVTAVRVSAADALNAGTLSLSDAQKVLEVTDEARALLDTAKDAEAHGTTSDAVSALNKASVILTDISTYLSSKGVK